MHNLCREAPDRMAAFSAWAFSGENSPEFSGSEDDFSGAEEYISCSGEQQASLNENTLEGSDNEEPTDLQCKYWPPPKRVLRALPHRA